MLREARIDAAAIEANTRTMRTHVAGAEVMAVVKADGYGHGALTAAQAALAGGAVWLGVADIDEALQLRAAGITAPVLSWLHGPQSDFAAAVAADVDLGVSSIEQLDRAAAASSGERIATVQLKTDTGLGRNGVAADRVTEVAQHAAQLERGGRLRVRGVFSHLSGTSEVDDAEQIAVFERHVDEVRTAGLDPQFVHLAASGAALTMPIAACNLVRLGISLYGLSPSPAIDARAAGLIPAMELSAPVIGVKRVPAGHGVSYGYQHRTTAATTLALVPLGYGDGVPRAASGRGPVQIGDRRFTVAGVVAMDQIVIDVGDAPVAVGDRAVLFGDPATGAPSADEWAEVCDTINYEIITRIGSRVTRTLA